jgi:glucuronate isomerase
MGDRYLDALEKHEAVAKNVTENLFERHMKPLLLGKSANCVARRRPPLVAIRRYLETHSSTRIFCWHQDGAPALPQVRRGRADFDYHCHLSPKDIAENRQFKNLFEIWLEGDHYKWRAMRSNGVAEKFCTGDAVAREKFSGLGRTVPHTLRNPLYHWTHLELKRYFGIANCWTNHPPPKIWKRRTKKLATPALTTQGILKKFKVKVVCTTDDPVDDLEISSRVRQKLRSSDKMLPAFRPDKALTVNSPGVLSILGGAAGRRRNVDINSFSAFLSALKKRHDFFHAQGCRLSDHGLNHCFADFCPEKTAAEFLTRRAGGKAGFAGGTFAVPPS